MHIKLVRINPEAPTRDPAIISILFPNTKPVADAASPEYEFSSAITTGMSAPPIGMTNNIPSRREHIISAGKR